MQVRYLDLPRQFDNPELLRLVTGVFARAQFVLGPEVAEFEKEFAQLCGTRFAVGVNSATDALFLALKALGVGPGEEVITVSNSFIATAGAIMAAGARPVFVDVGPDYNMNADLLEAAITSRTRAILPVHLTGNPADMAKITQVAGKHSLFVVEDAAQAVGARLDGKGVGSLGSAGCFSLHPLKNLNVAGDGGVVTTDSPEVYHRLILLRNHGLKNRDEIDSFGYNSRLDTIQAVVARYNLKSLDRVTEKRRQNARLYDQLLAGLEDDVVIPPRNPEADQVFHTYVIQVDRREELVEYLSGRQIETKIHYPIPIHLQAPCRALGWKSGCLPETEKQAGRILTLPIHQFLTEAQIQYVAATMKEFYRRKKN
jgi:dTDP-4-amino-4,6-dideoxygalactose transaminase